MGESLVIMEIALFVALSILVAYVIYRNVVLIGRFRHNKEYIECYKEMLAETDGAYERICKYIDNESSEEFQNKARVLKLYVEMDRELDVTDTLNNIDLKKVFYRNDKYSKKQVMLNSEVFIWLYLNMARARKLSKFDVLNSLYEKISVLKEMDNRVEFRLCKAIYNALCEKEDAGVAFLSSLLDGGYVGYEYDKNFIGLYKRLAAATLAYSGEPMEDFYKEDLPAFAATQIGKVYMRDLEIIEKYPPKINENAAEPDTGLIQDTDKTE